jgi:hypothetical protein
MSGKGYSRRGVAVGGGVAAALGIAALGVTMPRLLGGRRQPSNYDDLLAQLGDRDAAGRVGHAMRAGQTAPVDSKTLARGLRQRFERRNINEVTDSDLAQGRLLEAQGWVLPESLALLCVLADAES